MVQRLKTCTIARADSFGAGGFGFREVWTESAAGISTSEAYPRVAIEVRGGRCSWFSVRKHAQLDVLIQLALTVLDSVRFGRRAPREFRHRRPILELQLRCAVDAAGGSTFENMHSWTC